MNMGTSTKGSIHLAPGTSVRTSRYASKLPSGTAIRVIPTEIWAEFQSDL
jgi:hypothetical protein